MGLTYGFYNSVDHDRVYDATQFGSIFDGVINDGVFQNIGELFEVTPHEGMEVFVGTGRAWFNGTWTLNDTKYNLELSPSHPVFSRIDAVVLEVNQESATRANSIKIVEGDMSSTPQRPTLVDDEFVHQHPLAYITIQPNATEITEADIQNVIGVEEEGCPFVTGILEVNSVDYLYSQWQASFETWFDHMKGQLDEDAAGHLQNEIDNLNIAFDATLTAGETELTFTDSRITEDSFLDLYSEDCAVGFEDVYASTGSVTFIFEEQEADINFRLRVANPPL